VGIWATGATANALLEGLALGLFAVMTDLRRVRPREERAVSASAEDTPALVVSFLTELIVLQQTEGFLVRTATVRSVGRPPTSLIAALSGERFDPTRHVARTEVKAVTFHDLEFDPERRRARVILDI
jgi:SHS2 domain-containing protein